MSELIWWVLASLAIGGGIGTITRTNPIASLLFLVMTFAALAGIYVLLGAHFIAAVQIIVYSGAILVLFLFVIMLLNLGTDYRSDLRGGAWIVAGFISAGMIGWALSEAFTSGGPVSPVAGAAIDESVRELNAVGAIARPLFRDFIVAFELTSVLLLVAIVGAVILAKRKV
jgi:NADH-quinone oxidoreductase subunit J